MLWLGDNIYLREPDWNSWTGIIHRYTHDRATPQLQPFMASVHNYAIWDDHDFGPNDSDKSFWNKNLTLKAFKLFWANPSYGTGDIKGTTTSFQWAMPISFCSITAGTATPTDGITNTDIKPNSEKNSCNGCSIIWQAVTPHLNSLLWEGNSCQIPACSKLTQITASTKNANVLSTLFIPKTLKTLYLSQEMCISRNYRF